MTCFKGLEKERDFQWLILPHRWLQHTGLGQNGARSLAESPTYMAGAEAQAMGWLRHETGPIHYAITLTLLGPSGNFPKV